MKCHGSAVATPTPMPYRPAWRRMAAVPSPAVLASEALSCTEVSVHHSIFFRSEYGASVLREIF